MVGKVHITLSIMGDGGDLIRTFQKDGGCSWLHRDDYCVDEIMNKHSHISGPLSTWYGPPLIP